MLQELANQKRLVELRAERYQEARKESAKTIRELSVGRLKLDMTREEVIAVWGKPESETTPFWTANPFVVGRADDGSTLTYPRTVLHFWNGKLTNAEKRAK